VAVVEQVLRCTINCLCDYVIADSIGSELDNRCLRYTAVIIGSCRFLFERLREAGMVMRVYQICCSTLLVGNSVNCSCEFRFYADAIVVISIFGYFDRIIVSDRYRLKTICKVKLIAEMLR
jgi:hypothetical protein